MRQDQYAQAQHWLRHAAQLMHAQAQPYLISPRSLGGGADHCRPCGVGPPWTDEVKLSLSMHELSLSMPDMLILAKAGQAISKPWLIKVSVQPKCSKFDQTDAIVTCMASSLDRVVWTHPDHS